MWNSLGSLRDRVRENAKVAAQVAQGVLQAAAAEDSEEEQSSAWQQWSDPNDQSSSPPSNQTFPPPSSQPFPPPPSDVPPPPPPSDEAPPPPPPTEDPPPPISEDFAPKAQRTKGRYVVTAQAPKPLRPGGILPLRPQAFQNVSKGEDTVAPESAAAEPDEEFTGHVGGLGDTGGEVAPASSAVENTENASMTTLAGGPAPRDGAVESNAEVTSTTAPIEWGDDDDWQAMQPADEGDGWGGASEGQWGTQDDSFGWGVGPDEQSVVEQRAALAEQSIPAGQPASTELLIESKEARPEVLSTASAIQEHPRVTEDLAESNKSVPVVAPAQEMPEEFGVLEEAAQRENGAPSEQPAGSIEEAAPQPTMDWGETDFDWNVPEEQSAQDAEMSFGWGSSEPQDRQEDKDDWFTSVQEAVPGAKGSEDKNVMNGTSNETSNKGVFEAESRAETFVAEDHRDGQLPEIREDAAVEVKANGVMHEAQPVRGVDGMDESAGQSAEHTPVHEHKEQGSVWAMQPESNTFVDAQPSLGDHLAHVTGVDGAEPSAAAQTAHEPVSIPQETLDIIESLRAEIQGLKLERSSILSENEARSKENDDLKRSVMSLKDELSMRSDDVEELTNERSILLQEKESLAAEKIQVERERDAAVQRGGDGIREARSLIEAMRSSQDVTERREAVISEQIDELRADLERISGERNSLITETENLKDELKQSESSARQREDELRQQLQLSVNEKEIACLERERALAASQFHVQEHKELLEAEQSRAASTVAYEAKIQELEDTIESVRREREDELVRIDAFTNQMEDMKERTRSIIEERNELYNQTLELQKEVEQYSGQADEARKSVMDLTRERGTIASERDEARQRYSTLRDQLGDVTKQLEAVSVERDRLLKQRAENTSASSSNSDKEKALAEECQRKAAMVAILQKKLTSAAAKIEKVTAQRGTFQRQRDEAGARLRAAGSEFATLNNKLESIGKVRDKLQREIGEVRLERDNLASSLQDLSDIAAQKRLVDDNLEASNKQLNELKSVLERTRGDLTQITESKSVLQQKCANLTTEISALEGKLEVTVRERDMLQAQFEATESESRSLQGIVSEQGNVIKESEKKLKALEVEITTVREKATLDSGIAKAQLTAEQSVREELSGKVKEMQADASQNEAAWSKLGQAVAASANETKAMLADSGLDDGSIVWPTLICDGSDQSASAVQDMVSSVMRAMSDLSREVATTVSETDRLRRELSESAQRLRDADAGLTSLAAKDEEIRQAVIHAEDLKRQIEVLHQEKAETDQVCSTLRDNLTSSDVRVVELDSELERLKEEMKTVMERSAQISSEELSQLRQDLERVTSNLKSIWGMLRKSLANHQNETYSEDVNDFDDVSSSDNIAVLTLRATASIVAELDRNRAQSDELAMRVTTAEAEVARLVDRAEIAEQERDALKGTNERLEKKARAAYATGEEEAQKKYEDAIANIQDELEDTRHELTRISEKAARSDKEAGELRALCSKLTSQFNGRTNELDEAEEKLVYLQDQVTSLEEDLEEAHLRLKASEEETQKARKTDVDRLTTELQETIGQVEGLERECAKLREECDVAQNTARESELVAETHRKGEENLQIAIEQLEAAQESAVEQRTIDLQKRLQDAERRCEEARKREEGVAMFENKLNIRDDEIKELRGAIGRLADERVELKLELEKSLSRLNHPDAGGQLVDRRVVRQLLVSYFRVGSVRRRDVLELMSRMLAFSDSDNVAVGLKRRALMDRIGSLVQPPEPDDASLPPLGTVSDKWIEFLMNETEEGEEQSRGW